MKTDNKRFQEILHQARLTCLGKFQMVQAKAGVNNADLITLKKEMDETTARFDNPAIWTVQIPFDEDKILNFVLAIDSVNPADLAQFLTDMRSLMTYLNDEVVTVSTEAANRALPSGMNQQVLNSITVAQRNITGRKTFFKNRGTDLDTDATFIPLQETQRTVMASYRKALNGNTVESTERDVNIFNMIGGSIATATELTAFFNRYKALTKAMNDRLPATPKP